MSFWENFERICKERGTTPTAVVKNGLGLSASKVTMWKNGSLPKEDVLKELAKTLSCNVSDFFADSTHTIRVVVNEDKSTKPSFAERYLVDLVRSIDAPTQYDLMSTAIQFDRSRGLGVFDKLSGNKKSVSSELTTTIVVPGTGKTKGLDPGVTQVAINGKSDGVMMQAARNVFRAKKKKKVTVTDTGTVIVR